MSNGEGVFLEVDEEDPFETVQLVAVTSNGQQVVVGGLETNSGRYEITKVED